MIDRSYLLLTPLAARQKLVEEHMALCSRPGLIRRYGPSSLLPTHAYKSMEEGSRGPLQTLLLDPGGSLTTGIR